MPLANLKLEIAAAPNFAQFASSHALLRPTAASPLLSLAVCKRPALGVKLSFHTSSIYIPPSPTNYRLL